jgi:molybdopterin converting factor small subunit
MIAVTRTFKMRDKIDTMITIRIPTPLRAYTSGQSEVNVNGANIAEALADLTAQYPAIQPHLFNEGGDLRPFVNLFVGERNIRDLQGINTPVNEGDRVMLIPSIAGGIAPSPALPRQAGKGAESPLSHFGRGLG